MLPAFVAKKSYYLSLLLRGRYKIIENYEFLRKKSYEPREVILKEQWERLHNILIYSYKEIPYYHRIFDEHNVNLDNLTVEEFQKIPFLTKEIIRKEFNNLYRIRPGVKWYYHSTSGSTGEPVRVIQDQEYSFWEAAVKHLFDEWALHKIGEPMIALWKIGLGAITGKISFRNKLANTIFYNRKFLNPIRLNPEIMRSYIKIINQTNIKFILSYPYNIYEIAHFAEENYLKVNPLKSIMTSAEVLFSYMRETIEGVFQCPVFNRYGSIEAGDIASECADHKGLHASSYTHYVEIVKEDGTPCKDGEQGEVVITLLTNYTMPLIRYKIGDMAVKTDEKCSCGKGLPMIKDITGRTYDFFVNQKGELIDGRSAFTPFFRLHGYIKKFSMIQESIDKINVSLVMDKSFEEEFKSDIFELKNRIQEFIGKDTEIEINIVDEILPGLSGKHRFFISKIKLRSREAI
jgi:phenylacetate-CoA ligase